MLLPAIKISKTGGNLYKHPLPPAGSYALLRGRGKKARTAPFIPPFRVVINPCSGGVINFKVVDAAGARIFSGNAGKLGLVTVEKTVQIFNEQVKNGEIQSPV